MTRDEAFMQRCIELASKGMGKVAPNPMVGCVVVHNDQIVGEGFHEYFGGPHAEVNALRSVKDGSLLSESTLYVNLEPCSHFGKTPPCSDLIVSKGIKRVVIGNIDPNPKVCGEGIRKLKQSGIEVVQGVLQQKCTFLNRRFITYHSGSQPYVILKWAESNDGFIAPADGSSVWLTSDESRKLVHLWRGEEQAILVGRKTVEADNPLLTTRLAEGKNPIRLIIDKDLRLGANRNVFNHEAETIVFNSKRDHINGHLHFIKLNFDGDVIDQILSYLKNRNILSLIVEGGSETLTHFIQSKKWCEARYFVAGKNLIHGLRAPKVDGTVIEKRNVGTDHLTVLLNTGS